MATDLSRLRELAEKATPGPWKAVVNADGDGHEIHMGTRLKNAGRFASAHLIEYHHCNWKGEPGWQEPAANAAFIAAADPATVIGLIERVEKMGAWTRRAIEKAHSREVQAMKNDLELLAERARGEMVAYIACQEALCQKLEPR